MSQPFSSVTEVSTLVSYRSVTHCFSKVLLGSIFCMR